MELREDGEEILLIGTNTSLPGNSKHTKGNSIRVQFSNDWDTPVNVQVSGRWKSN